MPLAKKIYTQNEYFATSNCVFNLNFLSLVLSEILGAPHLHGAPQRPSSGKMLTQAQVLAYVYIIVNFQLCSSINVGLTECSLYNTFCIERSQKMVFWGGFWGQGLRYLVETP